MTPLAIWLPVVASIEQLQEVVNGIAFSMLLGCAAAALFAAAVWMVDTRRQQGAGEHEHAETARGDRKGDSS